MTLPLQPKKIFITYGDSNYQDSLIRIRQEAIDTGVFNETILYTPELLPDQFKEYANQYKRGGGYWLWKPWIIQNTLNNINEGDIVVYADAGCTLQKHKDWQYYFNRLAHNDGIFFITSGKNKKWCKQEVFSFFNTSNNLWKFANQIQATFLIIKKTKDDDIIQRWCDLAVHHPHLFMDVKQENRSKESPAFKEHRHDQSVLTACVCTSKRLSHYLLLPEKMEKRYKNGQAVLASRISSTSVRGANKSTPAKSTSGTIINNLIVNPVRRMSIRLLFLLSRI